MRKNRPYADTPIPRYVFLMRGQFASSDDGN
jgi:hypothetical protein